MPTDPEGMLSFGRLPFARRALVRAAAALMLLGGLANSAVAACATDARVVEACFDVHGRLRIDTNLRTHLWPAGTHRLLAVHYRRDAPEPEPPLPGNVAKILGLDNELFGDFRICPFTADRPGRMRIVCIDKASHLVVRALKAKE